MRGQCRLLTIALLSFIQMGLSSPFDLCESIDNRDVAIPVDPEVTGPRIMESIMVQDSSNKSQNKSLSEPHDSLRISSLCPSFGVEYVVLRNAGGKIVEIKGCSISDGEGKVTITANHSLQPGQELYLCSNLSLLRKVYPNESAYSIHSNATSISGRYVLADEGDEAILTGLDGEVIDVVIYGDSDYSGAGWTGKSIKKPTKGHEIHRKSNDITLDTNSSLDWYITTPARSEFTFIAALALVEPFLSPGEARSMLIREFQHASSSIKASVYELDDPEIVSVLSSRARNAVDVAILLEGQPVGGLSEMGKSSAWELEDAGAIMSFLKSRDGFKRYDYLHCKYAIMDGHRSVIMSENWVKSGMDHNRGWGVVVESRDVASFLTDVFEQDSFNGSLDIQPIGQVLDKDDNQMIDLPFVDDQDPTDLPQFQAYVRPLLAPDYARDRIADLMQNASSRILVEQFYCSPSWLRSDGLVSSLFSAASRGVSVRVLLDSSWFSSGETRNNTEIVEGLNRKAQELSVDLRARLVSQYHPFQIIHNKGIIIDNTTIVSSMNWVDASFDENREVGIEISSSEVAMFFGDTFWMDWATDPYPPIVNLSFYSATVYEGTPVLLDASRSTDNSGIASIRWDDGGDGSFEWEGPINLVRLEPGKHLISVIILDKFNNSATSEVEILVLRTIEVGKNDLLLYVPLGVGTGVFVAWKILKRIKTG